ncbi:MAG: outer membrane protein assembly factor BamD, partial [Deltaproteobacteria bacterium]
MRRLFAFAVLGLFACAAPSPRPRDRGAGPVDEAPQSPEEAKAARAYERGLEALRGGEYQLAIGRFEALRTRHPYSRYAPLAELRIADALFGQGSFLEAAERYRTFVKLRPTHPEADYAAYREALSLYREAPSDFFLFPPSYEKDLEPIRELTGVLERFLRTYPDSRYAPEARELLAKARRRLALHELYVADFYRRRGHWRGAAGRLETVLRDFSGLGFDARARVELAEAYAHLDPPRLDDARRLLEA